jgi:DNA-binding NarL/FixJ family response regulator
VLADDSPTLRTRLVSLLSPLPNLEIVGEAKNGFEALETVERLAPDVLVLDLRMPCLNGFNVMRVLQSRSVSIKIVVLSAFADDEARRKCVDLGAWQVFEKVTELDEFLEAMKNL